MNTNRTGYQIVDRMPGVEKIPTLMQLDPLLKHLAARAASKKNMSLSAWTRELMRKAIAEDARTA